MYYITSPAILSSDTEGSGQVLCDYHYPWPVIMKYSTPTIFSLEAENEGDKVLLIFLHFSPLESAMLCTVESSENRFGKGYV